MRNKEVNKMRRCQQPGCGCMLTGTKTNKCPSCDRDPSKKEGDHSLEEREGYVLLRLRGYDK